MTKVHGTTSEPEVKPTVADFEDEARELVKAWLGEADKPQPGFISGGHLRSTDLLALIQSVKDALSAAYLKGKRDEYYAVMGTVKAGQP